LVASPVQNRPVRSAFTISLALVLPSAAALAQAHEPFADGKFSWRASAPLIDVGSGAAASDPHVSIKDPTVVFTAGWWHVFATLRMKSGKVDIEYLRFRDWSQAAKAPRHLLALHDQYYCAPQILYFTPHQKWYLVYQLADKSRSPAFGPCFSTTTDLSDTGSWTRPCPMVTNAPPKPKWLDFWVICDDTRAHLFYTSLDGHMWRRETLKSSFPFGWSEPQLALRGDIFEASHTYKIRGREQYLTIIEAQGDRCRCYKAYLANRLDADGEWRGLADSPERAFAAAANVRQEPHWTDNISHGELLRAGTDERMEIDAANLRFLFQGASNEEYRQRYGAIPWRLGLLELNK